MARAREGARHRLRQSVLGHHRVRRRDAASGARRAAFGRVGAAGWRLRELAVVPRTRRRDVDRPPGVRGTPLQRVLHVPQRGRDEVARRRSGGGVVPPAFNPAFPDIPDRPFSPLVGAHPFRRPANSGTLAAFYTRGRLGLALAGQFSGKSDDSTFAFDAFFGNTMLLPNKNLDGGYAKVDVTRLLSRASSDPDVHRRSRTCWIRATRRSSGSRRCRSRRGSARHHARRRPAIGR